MTLWHILLNEISYTNRGFNSGNYIATPQFICYYTIKYVAIQKTVHTFNDVI